MVVSSALSASITCKCLSKSGVNSLNALVLAGDHGTTSRLWTPPQIHHHCISGCLLTLFDKDSMIHTFSIRPTGEGKFDLPCTMLGVHIFAAIRPRQSTTIRG